MMEYFKKEDYKKAISQKKKLSIIYTIIAIIYGVISAVVLSYYLTLPYLSQKISTLKTIFYTITVIFAFFSVLFFCLPFKMVRKYIKFAINLTQGRKEESEAHFLEYDNKLVEKEGVECKTLIFLEWNKYKNDYYERRVFVFNEKPFPKFIENQKIKLITQGNFLVSYEILKED